MRCAAAFAQIRIAGEHPFSVATAGTAAIVRELSLKL
jgi:hypothetical protein